MQIGIRKETTALESRVAITPEGASKLIKQGFDVVIEYGAGEKSSFTDQAYIQAGATVSDLASVMQSDILYTVNPLTIDVVKKLKAGTTVVGFTQPAINTELVEAYAQQNVTALAMDMVPRISRAQSMDALSSLANIAGYRAVIEAAAQFGRFLNGQITAAGKIAPAKVLVIGAGVAGLAAIGTAKNLGAQVRAFDARPEAKDQVESMGGKFLTIGHVEKQKTNDGYTRETTEDFNKKSEELYLAQSKEVDIIITTAAIPGRKAPVLITEEMVNNMKPGSVIVDLAAATGGNCALTKANEIVTTKNDVKIIGYTNYYSKLGMQSSSLYSNNLVNLTKLLCPQANGQLEFNQEDVIVRNMTVTLYQPTAQQATIEFPPPPISVSATPSAKAPETKETKEEKPAPKSAVKKWLPFVILVAIFLFVVNVISGLPAEFISHVNLFVIASVLGYFIIWNVHSALHTPLMSLTNALSGIVIIGAMLQIDTGTGVFNLLAYIAIFIAALNVFGGFSVTNRMLKMFIKKDDSASDRKEGGK